MGTDSAYIKSLPQWAQELLNKPDGAGSPAPGPMNWSNSQESSWSGSGAGQTPGAPGRQIQWNAPSGVHLPAAGTAPVFSSRSADQITQPAAMEWKAPGGDGTGESAKPLSDAEIRRTADKVYRLIEERLRRELRRSGR